MGIRFISLVLLLLGTLFFSGAPAAAGDHYRNICKLNWAEENWAGAMKIGTWVSNLDPGWQNNGHTALGKIIKEKVLGDYFAKNVVCDYPGTQGDRPAPAPGRCDEGDSDASAVNATVVDTWVLQRDNRTFDAVKPDRWKVTQLDVTQCTRDFRDSDGGVQWVDVGFIIQWNDDPPPPPTCSLTLSPGSIETGESATLSWSTTNASSFSLNQGLGSNLALSGSRSVSPTATTTYTGTVEGLNGTLETCQTTLTVTPPPDPKPTAVSLNCGTQTGSCACTTDNRPRWHWTPSTHATDYRIYRSWFQATEGSLCSVVERNSGTCNVAGRWFQPHSTALTESGTYSLAVAGVSDTNRLGDKTPSSNVTIDNVNNNPARNLSSNANAYNCDTGNVRLSWNAPTNPLGKPGCFPQKKYNVKVWRDNAANPFRDAWIDETQYTFTGPQTGFLGTANYRYEVIVADVERTGPTTEYVNHSASAQHSFSLTCAPPDEPPEEEEDLAAPSELSCSAHDGGGDCACTTDTRPYFRWSPVSGADTYQIYRSWHRPDDGNECSLITDNRADLLGESRLEDGNYTEGDLYPACEIGNRLFRPRTDGIAAGVGGENASEKDADGRHWVAVAGRSGGDIGNQTRTNFRIDLIGPTTPTNLDGSVACPSLILRWQASSNPGCLDTWYQVQVKKQSNNVIIQDVWTKNTSYVLFDQNAGENDTYSFRVRSADMEVINATNNYFHHSDWSGWKDVDYLCGGLRCEVNEVSGYAGDEVTVNVRVFDGEPDGDIDSVEVGESCVGDFGGMITEQDNLNASGEGTFSKNFIMTALPSGASDCKVKASVFAKESGADVEVACQNNYRVGEHDPAVFSGQVISGEGGLCTDTGDPVEGARVSIGSAPIQTTDSSGEWGPLSVSVQNSPQNFSISAFTPSQDYRPVCHRYSLVRQSGYVETGGSPMELPIIEDIRPGDNVDITSYFQFAPPPFITANDGEVYGNADAGNLPGVVLKKPEETDPDYFQTSLSGTMGGLVLTRADSMESAWGNNTTQGYGRKGLEKYDIGAHRGYIDALISRLDTGVNLDNTDVMYIESDVTYNLANLYNDHRDKIIVVKGNVTINDNDSDLLGQAVILATGDITLSSSPPAGGAPEGTAVLNGALLSKEAINIQRGKDLDTYQEPTYEFNLNPANFVNDKLRVIKTYNLNWKEILE